MEIGLLEVLLQEAGEGSRSNPASYFINICRTKLQNGVTTLDKHKQNATQYRQALPNTGTDRRITRGSYQVIDEDAPF